MSKLSFITNGGLVWFSLSLWKIKFSLDNFLFRVRVFCFIIPNQILEKTAPVLFINVLFKCFGIFRSSHWRCSMKKGVLKHFEKFIGKRLCQTLFFNEVANMRPATLLKKILQHKCFPVNFAKLIFKNTFFAEHLWATPSTFLRSI